MRFARAFGGEGDAPGQFKHPRGVAVVRGLLVVSEGDGARLQVLMGVELTGICAGAVPRGVCADEQRVWVTTSEDRVHVLKISS